MNEIVIQADLKDIDFLIQVIKGAEASGTDVISYERIFHLSSEELEELLTQTLQEHEDGQELTYNNFLIYKIDNKPVGACASWIENPDESSNQIKSEILSYYLPENKWKEAQDSLKLISSIGIDRTPGFLQLESFFVLPEFRGRRITKKLIEAHIAFRKSDHKIGGAEIILMNNNKDAQNAYEKAGFKITKTSFSDDETILNYLPSNGKILMHKII